jgi:hypothetical protein
MVFACDNTLLAVTSTTGESPRSLVAVNTATAAASLRCSLASQSLVSLRIVVALDRSRLVHFVGDANPTMEILNVPTSTGGVCAVTAVAAYRTNALSLFGGAPVISAVADTVASSGTASAVFVVAGSPASLYKVTATGTITLVAQSQLSPPSGALEDFAPISLTFAQPRPAAECSGASTCMCDCMSTVTARAVSLSDVWECGSECGSE